MKNILLATLFLIFISCSGGTNAPRIEASSQSRNLSATQIDQTFKIDLSKIIDYKESDSIEKQYLSVVNYVRGLNVKCNDANARQGPVASLVWNALLEDAVKDHSKDMLAIGKMTHLGSGTSTDFTGKSFSPSRASHFNERILFNGYNYSSSAENVAYRAKYPTLEEDAWVGAMENWMKSKTGHCSNLMNSTFEDFAMAESRGTKDIIFDDGISRSTPAAYWTQNFAKKKN